MNIIPYDVHNRLPIVGKKGYNPDFPRSITATGGSKRSKKGGMAGLFHCPLLHLVHIKIFAPFRINFRVDR